MNATEIRHGDCRALMAELPENSVDAIVTDPPYLIGFMGKEWDGPATFVERKSRRRAGSFESAHGNHNPTDAADSARTRRSENQKAQDWHYAWAVGALRVAKPGAHLLAFGGTRTHHRLMCAIEDAGWEIRDTLMWVYGSGFPKSLDVSRAIDKAAGAAREVVAENPCTKGRKYNQGQHEGWVRPWMADPDAGAKHITAPATDAAKRWDGWGTALKPAWEPIILARKPLEGTVAENVQKWGTGALNIDGCRVGMNPGYRYLADRNGTTFHGQQGERIKQTAEKKGAEFIESTKSRFPANLIHDGSEEMVGLFPYSISSGGGARNVFCKNNSTYGKGKASVPHYDSSRGDMGFGDSGSAARFFYCAKASRAERGEGNSHPTVKPLALMRYLCRLVTPPGGVILDPFMGSGSTGVAARMEFFRFIGIEQDEESCRIARGRIGQEGLLLGVAP